MLRIISLLIVLLVSVLEVAAWSSVTGLEIYRNGVFILQEFEIKGEEEKLSLLVPVSEDRLEVLKITPGLEIYSLELEKEEPQTELYQRLKALREQEKEISSKVEQLKKEQDLLVKILSNSEEALSFSDFQEFFSFYEKLWQKKNFLESRLSAIREEIKELESRLLFEKVSVVRLVSGGKGKILFRYPADGLIGFRESCALYGDFWGKTLRLKAALILWQKSGQRLGPLEVSFYPRSERYNIVSPPPFKPWYLEDHFFPLPKAPFLMKKAKRMVKKLKPEAEREVAPGAIWERVRIKNVLLPAGKPVYLPVAEDFLPAISATLEVPLYANTQAFFRLKVKPAKSYPRLRAKLYLNGSFVGEAWVGPFTPGAEIPVYFGPARLLEVKREVLKDLSGESFWGKEIQEKETKTILINHYSRNVQVEVIDRVPVPKKRESRVEVEAEPRWVEKTPEGKIIWRFTLAPEEEKTIRLYLKIRRPKGE